MRSDVVLIRYHDLNLNTRLPHSLNLKQGVLPPLGLAYLASGLEREGVSVRIIDAQAEGLDAAALAAAVRESAPGLVGITAMTPAARGALEAASIVRRLGPKVVMGGPHLSLFAAETLNSGAADFIIEGEAEESLPGLWRAMTSKADYDDVAGLGRIVDGQAVRREPALVDDLDRLAWPARHLLPMRRYRSILGRNPVSTMIASRGCPFRCTYCFKGPSDLSVRHRDPVDVVDEMEHLVTDHGIREVMFYDDTFTASRRFVEEFCHELARRPRRIPWEAPTRPELVDAELLRRMADAGCVRLRFGVESGAAERREAICRNGPDDSLRRVFRQTREAGISPFAYFMVGFPNESRSEFEKTLQFAIELDADHVMFTTVTPLPGTVLYEEAVSAGKFPGEYWDEYVSGRRRDRAPYLIPEAAGRTAEAYRRYYLRPRFIGRHLAGIRNIDDVRRYCTAAAGLVGLPGRSR